MIFTIIKVVLKPVYNVLQYVIIVPALVHRNMKLR